MADFHQNGNITTLHNLRSRPAEHLVHEISVFAETRKVTLILPCLYSELEGPALTGIIDELSKVSYLHRIIIGLDQADAEQYQRARAFFDRLPQKHVVIWNSSPRMLQLEDRLRDLGLAPQEPGKGKWLPLERSSARHWFHDPNFTAGRPWTQSRRSEPPFQTHETRDT